MILCIADSCKAPLEPDWAFCPMCGTDNRAPETQAPVDCEEHLYFEPGWYCVRCGELRGQSKATRKYEGWRQLVGGVLILALAVICLHNASLKTDNLNDLFYGFLLLIWAIVYLGFAYVAFARLAPSRTFRKSWTAPWNRSSRWYDSDD